MGDLVDLARERERRNALEAARRELRAARVPEELVGEAVRVLEAQPTVDAICELAGFAIAEWARDAVEVTCLRSGDCGLCGRWYTEGSVHACIGPNWALRRNRG